MPAPIENADFKRAAVIHLHYRQGYGPRKIAAYLGIPKSSVFDWLKQGAKAIKNPKLAMIAQRTIGQEEPETAEDAARMAEITETLRFAFHPDEVRIPKGMPGGGEWVSLDKIGEEAAKDIEKSRTLSSQHEFQALKKQWSAINADLLQYIDNPGDPKAIKDLHDLKAVAVRMNHLQADTGGREGVGMPGGPRDVVVIGGGPGGMGTAINARADGLDTLLLEAAPSTGGQSAHSSRIENYPGYPVGVTGTRLAADMREQATRLGADIRTQSPVVGLRHDPETGLKYVKLANGEEIPARSVVIAGGIAPRHLDFPGGNDPSVIYGDGAAMTDKAQGRPVVVIGGSNGAAQAALGAARRGSHATVLARSPITKSMSDYQVQALRNNPLVDVIEGDEIANYDGSGVITKKGVKVPGVKAIGIFAGGGPATQWMPPEVTKGAHGAVQVNDNLETSIPGVFAVGDVRTGGGERVLAAAADGQVAEHNLFGYITTGAPTAPATRPMAAAEAPDQPEHTPGWDDLLERLLQADLEETGATEMSEALDFAYNPLEPRLHGRWVKGLTDVDRDFKPGDTVRVHRPGYEDHGHVGTVTGTTGLGSMVDVDKRAHGGRESEPYYPDELEKFEQGVEPITDKELAERGTAGNEHSSRLASHDEYQELAAEGRQMLEGRKSSPPTGLDKNWASIKQSTHQAVLKSWGGETIDAHTGQAVPEGANKYALTAREPGQKSVTVHENPTPEEWSSAMDEARQRFATQLAKQGMHLGVFHDDALGQIDIDPTLVLDSLHEVEAIGAHTHAVGGAYNYADGNGYWPPHVASGAEHVSEPVAANEAGAGAQAGRGPVGLPDAAAEAGSRAGAEGLEVTFADAPAETEEPKKAGGTAKRQPAKKKDGWSKDEPPLDSQNSLGHVHFMLHGKMPHPNGSGRMLHGKWGPFHSKPEAALAIQQHGIQDPKLYFFPPGTLHHPDEEQPQFAETGSDKGTTDILPGPKTEPPDTASREGKGYPTSLPAGAAPLVSPGQYDTIEAELPPEYIEQQPPRIFDVLSVQALHRFYNLIANDVPVHRAVAASQRIDPDFQMDQENVARALVAVGKKPIEGSVSDEDPKGIIAAHLAEPTPEQMQAEIDVLMMPNWSAGKVKPPQYVLDAFDTYEMAESDTDDLSLTIEDLALQSYTEGLNAALEAVGRPGVPTVTDPYVRDRITVDADDTARGVANTYNSDLGTRVYTEWVEGLSTQGRQYSSYKLDRAITDWAEKRTQWKSNQIADTETTRWYNQAIKDFQEHNAGLLPEATFDLSPDSCKCDVCCTAVARNPYTLSEMLTLHPPFHPNCVHNWIPNHQGQRVLPGVKLWDGQETEEQRIAYDPFVAAEAELQAFEERFSEVTPFSYAGRGRGNERTLKDWFENRPTKHGKVSGIPWGTGAPDFYACLAIAGKHMPDAEARGFCANRHHAATGHWPGHAPGETDAQGHKHSELPELLTDEEWEMAVQAELGEEGPATLEFARHHTGHSGGGNAQTLRDYWSAHTKHGKSSKIVWGHPGDFDECVARVSKFMTPEQAKGYCNRRHVQATGRPPGHAPAEEAMKKH